jgi:hypothetical protein
VTRWRYCFDRFFGRERWVACDPHPPFTTERPHRSSPLPRDSASNLARCWRGWIEYHPDLRKPSEPPVEERFK